MGIRVKALDDDVLIRGLVQAARGARVITDPDVVESYRRDRADLCEPGKPLGVVLAESTDQVSSLLSWADGNRIPVVPRGAGTGLSGGAAAMDGCLVLSLEKMTAIRSVDIEERLIEVEAGVLNADVGTAVRELGLFYAPDPSSYEISTIGGNIATNAGGLKCVKYGVTREAVAALEVVLSDGSVLTTGRRTIKDVVGYDLTDLFVGSEGTLGVNELSPTNCGISERGLA
jgi:glycolate oxidase